MSPPQTSILSHYKIREVRDAICLRPQTDLPRVVKRLVLDLEQRTAIQENGEQVISEHDSQSLPFPAGDVVLHAVGTRRQSLRRDRQPHSGLNLVQDDVIL